MMDMSIYGESKPKYQSNLRNANQDMSMHLVSETKDSTKKVSFLENVSPKKKYGGRNSIGGRRSG